jgi:hypothetical protein
MHSTAGRCADRRDSARLEKLPMRNFGTVTGPEGAPLICAQPSDYTSSAMTPNLHDWLRRQTDHV